MAKGDEFFSWVQFWMAFVNQPDDIKKEWMVGKGGLVDVLKNEMTDISKWPQEYQDDVLEFAPKYIQKYFGYVSKQVRVNLSKDSVGKYKVNQSYKTDLMIKLGL